jgi:hypothetical protein
MTDHLDVNLDVNRNVNNDLDLDPACPFGYGATARGLR